MPMARPWPIEYEGAVYHVFSSGNNEQDIFVTEWSYISLLYCLWQEGKHRNLQMGDFFGLSLSSVNRRVTIIRKKMALEQNFQSKIEAIKSQIEP